MMFLVKKKGGIFIKKIYIFLILFFSCFLLNVKAETATFYEAEYISNIYLNRYQYTTYKNYYQQARFFRKTGTNEFVYCIEPFIFLDESTPYESSTTISSLTESQIDEIKKIAYFGYGYGDHTTNKWYAITQVMIWRVADRTGGYFFSDSLNGRNVNYYASEIETIQQLVNSYSTLPSFANQTYEIVEGQDLTLEDTNNRLSQFISTSHNTTIENNTLKITNLEEGEYTISLTKDSPGNTPTIFYASPTSQNLVQRGDQLPKVETNIQVKVQKTYLEVTKIDKDTQSTTPSGEASLEGTTYELQDEEKNTIQEIIVENNQIFLENLDYGTYYLTEIKAGTGYLIDNQTYEINICEETPEVSLTLENEVIKKKIILEKKYGEDNNFQEEENISFSITNNKENIIDIITTNSQGIAEIILPYGTYTITQINTTNGYEKIEPLIIQVDNTEEEIIELRDWKIPVPNTYKEENSSLSLILYLLWIILL